MKKYMVVLGFICCLLLNAVHSSGSYTIARIDTTSLESAIVQEHKNANVRQIKKYATMAAVFGSVYGLIQLQGYFFPAGITKGDVPVVHSSAPKIVAGEDKNMIQKFVAEVSSTALSLGKWAVSTVPSFFGMAILSQGSRYFTDTWGHFKKLEKLQGFIACDTKVWELFNILKASAAPFDIYSKRLSLDVNFGDHKVAIEQFVKDATDVIEDHADSTRFYLAQMLRNNYTKRCSQLAELQNYALNTVALQQRVEVDQEATVLETNAIDRQSLADFSNFLIKEIERVIAFYSIRIQGNTLETMLKEHAHQFVEQTNIFAGLLEEKLAKSTADLYEVSKKGEGVFDLIYDFEAFVRREIKSLDMRLQFV